MAVCNILRMKENKELDSYQEHCLKDRSAFSREEIVHRIQPYTVDSVMTRLGIGEM